MAAFFTSCTRAAPPAGAQAPLRVEAAETYVQLYPADGFLFIKEYYLSTLEQDSAAVASQASRIAGLVRTRRYCAARFAFTAFTAMEERLYRDRGFITVECRLLSRDRNAIRLATDAFGQVLARPVAVAIDEADVRVRYAGLDVVVRGNNAKAVLGNGDSTMVVWRNGSRYYEVVFGPEGRPASSFRSLAAYMREDVASPEMSEREIQAWRRGP